MPNTIARRRGRRRRGLRGCRRRDCVRVGRGPQVRTLLRMLFPTSSQNVILLPPQQHQQHHTKSGGGNDGDSESEPPPGQHRLVCFLRSAGRRPAEPCEGPTRCRPTQGSSCAAGRPALSLPVAYRPRHSRGRRHRSRAAPRMTRPMRPRPQWRRQTRLLAVRRCSRGADAVGVAGRRHGRPEGPAVWGTAALRVAVNAVLLAAATAEAGGPPPPLAVANEGSAVEEAEEAEEDWDAPRQRRRVTCVRPPPPLWRQLVVDAGGECSQPPLGEGALWAPARGARAAVEAGVGGGSCTRRGCRAGPRHGGPDRSRRAGRQSVGLGRGAVTDDRRMGGPSFF